MWPCGRRPRLTRTNGPVERPGFPATPGAGFHPTGPSLLTLDEFRGLMSFVALTGPRRGQSELPRAGAASLRVAGRAAPRMVFTLRCCAGPETFPASRDGVTRLRPLRRPCRPRRLRRPRRPCRPRRPRQGAICAVGSSRAWEPLAAPNKVGSFGRCHSSSREGGYNIPHKLRWLTPAPERALSRGAESRQEDFAED